MNYLVSVDLVNELVEKINEVSEAQREAISNATGGSGGDEAEKESGDAYAEATFASLRLVYRNITKYIRSRQSAEESWNSIDV